MKSTATNPFIHYPVSLIRCFPRFFVDLDNDQSDCILVIGVSKSKLAVILYFIIFISLALTFYMIYDMNAFQKTSKNKYEFEVKKRLPQALIIGTRKSGTGALLEMLNLHSDIKKASKEIHFFDRDDNYNLGLEWYREQMPQSFPNQMTVEKSPSYFISPEVPERIKAMNSSIKLLLIVREPLTRAISDYTQLLSNYNIGVPTLPQKQPQQSPFETLVLLPNGSINEFYKPIMTSIYHHYMYKWLDLFPKNQIHIVNGEVLIENPIYELRKIEKFLNLMPKIENDSLYFNKTKGFYCLRNEKNNWCLRQTKGRKHPRIDPTVITKIRKYFHRHNQKFYELINENLNWPIE